VYKTAAIFIKRLKNEHAANFYIIGEFFAKILYLDGIGVQIMIIKHDTQHKKQITIQAELYIHPKF